MKTRADQPPNPTPDRYHTTDIYLGAYLKARGLRLVDRLLEGRRVTFVFEDRADRKCLVQEFYADGMVRANDFIHALQDLKAAVYNV